MFFYFIRSLRKDQKVELIKKWSGFSLTTTTQMNEFCL